MAPKKTNQKNNNSKAKKVRQLNQIKIKEKKVVNQQVNQ